MESAMFENTQLAALVAAKLCHDLVEPMGAMIQGLEMIKEQESKIDPDALSLLDQGVAKAWAKLEFFRFAVGGSQAEGEATLDEGRDVANRLFGVLKSDLKWSAPAVTMPRRGVRVVVNLLLVANECLPRGGEVELVAEAAGAGGEIRVVATGPRASLRSTTAAALRGETPEEGFIGSVVQPTLTGMFARQAGIELAVRESEERVELIARSPEFKL
jgi:histidine phosphotransferase ChpT